VSLKESLQCEVCSSTWSRTRTRGRKPRVCPQCIKDEIVPHQEVVYMPERTTSKKTAKKWVCPQCSSSITMFVDLTYPPICRNPQFHSTKSVEMQINGRKEQVA
jgi:hypothetical protein